MFSFEFTEQEANLVLKALADMPFKEVSSIINKIAAEADKQVKAKAEEADKQEEKKVK